MPLTAAQIAKLDALSAQVDNNSAGYNSLPTQSSVSANNAQPSLLTPQQIAKLDALNAQVEAQQANQQPQSSLLQKISSVFVPTFSNMSGSPQQLNAPSISPINDARDLAQGALTGIGNAMSPLASSLMPIAAKKMASLGTTPAQAFAPIGSGQNTTQANFMRGIGQYAPYAAAAEVDAPVSLLGKLIAQTGAGFASGAANAQPNQSAIGQGIKGALLNMGPGMAMHAAEALRPTNLLRGNLTPQQLQQNVSAAQGTSTGLGRILGNKALNSTYESIAPNFPFTGASSAMQGTVNQLQGQAKGILSSLLGNNDPATVMPTLQNAMRDSYQSIKGTLNNKANALNDAADNAGVTVGRTNQQAVAQQHLDEINNDSELKDSQPAELMNDLQNYASGKYEPQTLKAADISSSKILGDKASGYFNNGQKYAGGIYNDLKAAKQADVNDSLDNATNPDVTSLRDDYRNYYAKEYAPYLDPDVQKFINHGQGDVDTLLNSFLKVTPNSDRSTQLNKLMTKLTPTQSNLVPYAYYSRALNDDGTVNLNKLSTLHENLGTNQENILLNNSNQQSALNNLTKNIRMNARPISNLSAPLNGSINAAFAPMGTMSAGAAKGAIVGGLPGALVGATVGIAAPAIAGQIATKALTSQPLRERIVASMLNNKPKFNKPQNIVAAQTLAQAIANSQQRSQ